MIYYFEWYFRKRNDYYNISIIVMEEMIIGDLVENYSIAEIKTISRYLKIPLNGKISDILNSIAGVISGGRKIAAMEFEKQDILEILDQRHPDADWDWVGLSNNPTITTEFITRHLDKPWHWGLGGLSINSAITPEFITRHLDKPLHWGLGGLSNNRNITSQILM
jgi:hypothetical protein